MKSTLFICIVGFNMIFSLVMAQENQSLQGVWIHTEESPEILMDFKSKDSIEFVRFDNNKNIQTIKANWKKQNNNLIITVGNKSQKLVIKKINNRELVMINDSKTIKLLKLEYSNKEKINPIFVNKTFDIEPSPEVGLIKIDFKNEDKVIVSLKSSMSEILSFETGWKKIRYNSKTLLLVNDFAIFSVEKIQHNALQVLVYRLNSVPNMVQTEIKLKEVTNDTFLEKEYALNSDAIRINVKKLDSIYKHNMTNATSNLNRKELITTHFKHIDSLLNVTYKKTLLKYDYLNKNYNSEDYNFPEGKSLYIDTQKAWIIFKEKEVEYSCAVYTNIQGGHTTGEYEFCLNTKLYLTKARLKRLLYHYDQVIIN